MRRSDRAGFTLIEVMAAAVILALVVVWLASAVGQMKRAEGDSRRRVDAALYADRVLAELEQGASSGAPLQVGKREVDEGLFQATVEVAALDPALVAAALGTEPPDPSAPRRQPTAADGGWLAAPGAEQTPPIVQATVRVTGKEGRFEGGVTRTTFFLNPAALSALDSGGSDEDDDEATE